MENMKGRHQMYPYCISINKHFTYRKLRYSSKVIWTPSQAIGKTKTSTFHCRTKASVISTMIIFLNLLGIILLMYIISAPYPQFIFQNIMCPHASQIYFVNSVAKRLPTSKVCKLNFTVLFLSVMFWVIFIHF